MKFKILPMLLGAFMLLFIMQENIYAVEPPHLSEKWLENAEEKIDFIVLDIKEKDRSNSSYINKIITLKAKVLSVDNTLSDLHKNSIIIIIYSHNYLIYIDENDGKIKPAPGPSIIPILNKGQEVSAYLNRSSKDTYKPAALAKSFKKRKKQ